ncbi:uncharacterized protein B0I36DRAFT_147192 [Microdochium trichocladiopsis]|uniref:Uncharacterized protein n=1 Tax=Microdochium trichocladiopsis TaxID=1682393 RepID=A0A9P9BP28_9PEZI|nr:uncharacterized protein B0I36DRAFT_147192 [Microdochium trichocladiopsis]KAH7028104.1 hypothetical protein B0I36DRAFT_147192 [Microdochium trichocladiopsis]
MFVHAGASLHGHEYSARAPPGTQSTAAAAGQRRHPSLLRSAFGGPAQRSSTPPASSVYDPPSPSPSPSPSPLPRSPLLPAALLSPKRSRPFSDTFVQAPAAAGLVSLFTEPKHVCSPQSQVMTEDEAGQSDTDGCISDSDVSRAAGSSRRARKQSLRTSTAYVLAQPAPKLRHKQRIMHTKPQLLTQLQLLAPGDRPRPVIDAYPSSAFAKTIMAPLLKRVPRIAGIKTELSVQDIMLVKSQDYAAHATDTDSDAGDDDMKARDLVAILSPLRTDDRVEIVMADGKVWTACPRNATNNGCSYDFVSVDENGATITARWARRRNGSKSAMPQSPLQQEYKYTFSIINPECRRHPIMATMMSSSLEIFDSYTTVSQSSNRYPPTSPSVGSAASSLSSGVDGKRSRQVIAVEEWQKNFIAVSAVWIASRAVWSADTKSVDMSTSTVTYSTPSSPLVTSPPSRVPSNTSNLALSIKKAHTTTALGTRDRSATMAQPVDPPRISILPKRATSTGAAFMQRRRAILRADSGSSEESDFRAGDKRARRALSGDWTGNIATGLGQTSLAAIALAEVADDHERASAPSPASATLSEVSTPSAVSEATGTSKPVKVEMWPNATTSTTPPSQTSSNVARESKANPAADTADTKARHAKWKSVTTWFTKLRAR